MGGRGTWVGGWADLLRFGGRGTLSSLASLRHDSTCPNLGFLSVVSPGGKFPSAQVVSGFGSPCALQVSALLLKVVSSTVFSGRAAARSELRCA